MGSGCFATASFWRSGLRPSLLPSAKLKPRLRITRLGCRHQRRAHRRTLSRRLRFRNRTGPPDDGNRRSSKANFRSRYAICFSDSEICFPASDSFLSRSISSCRSRSFSRLRRSFSRSSGRCSDCSGFAPCDERCLPLRALKHIHCQVSQPNARSNVKILRGFCNRPFPTT
jgi:hypothetical protein